MQPAATGRVGACNAPGALAAVVAETRRNRNCPRNRQHRTAHSTGTPSRAASRREPSHPCRLDLYRRIHSCANRALDGLKATTHWLAAQELARRHPAINVDPDVLYVDNGNILTSAGAAAGFDLCLHLVRRDLGAEIAARAARSVVMPLERSGGQAQFIVYEQPAVIESMGPLLLWLGQNVGKQVSLSAIARHAAMSTRTLSRRFLEQVGTTPVRWIAGARVRRAQQLLETTGLSIEQVAAEVGFRSASVLREHFGGIVGTTPLAYRRAFGNAKSLESRSSQRSAGSSRPFGFRESATRT